MIGDTSNIHIYPSALGCESRILREVAAIKEMNIFEEIIVVGVTAKTHKGIEKVQENVTFRRFGPSRTRNRWRNLASHILWCVTVTKFCVRHRPICVNCHSLSVLPIGVILKVLMASKLIYDAHELETEKSSSKGIRKVIEKVMERILVRWCDYTIVVSEPIAEWYRAEYGMSRISVIYNAPEQEYLVRNEYLRNAFAIPDDTRIFVYSGLFGSGRGIDALLAAFPVVTGAAIVFLGYGPLQERILAASRESGNVYLHNAVPPDHVVEVIAGADFGVSCIEPVSLSYKYSMPNKLLEYVMANKPVLVSDIPEQRKMVETFGIGAVATSLAPAELKAAIEFMINGDQGRFQTGLERARRNFAWAHQEAELRRIYKSELGYCG